MVKQFECFICHKKIKDRLSNLQRHMKKHSRLEKRISCQKCDLTLSNDYNFNKHIIRWHKGWKPKEIHFVTVDKTTDEIVEHEIKIKKSKSSPNRLRKSNYVPKPITKPANPRECVDEPNDKGASIKTVRITAKRNVEKVARPLFILPSIPKELKKKKRFSEKNDSASDAIAVTTPTSPIALAELSQDDINSKNVVISTNRSSQRSQIDPTEFSESFGEDDSFCAPIDTFDWHYLLEDSQRHNPGESVDLIDFETSQLQVDSNKFSSNILETIGSQQSIQNNILAAIGFDGPINDAFSATLSDPIKPNFESSDVPDKLIDSLVIRDMHSLPKHGYARKRPPIPKLFPLHKLKCRSSVASRIVFDVADAQLVAPALPDELLVAIDLHMDSNFGKLK